MKLIEILQKIETAIADAALIERTIAAIVHGLGERTQPQAHVQGEVGAVGLAHRELLGALQSAHVDLAAAAGVTSPFAPPADPDAPVALVDLQPAAQPAAPAARRPKAKARRR